MAAWFEQNQQCVFRGTSWKIRHEKRRGVSGKKRARDTARDKGERNVRVFQRHRRSRESQIRSEGNEWGGGCRGMKGGGANHKRLSFVFSALFLRVSRALGHLFAPTTPKGAEIGSLSLFRPAVFWKCWRMKLARRRRGENLEITNARARWTLFSMMKGGPRETWGCATTMMPVILLTKICFHKKGPANILKIFAEPRDNIGKNLCTYKTKSLSSLPHLKVNGNIKNTIKNFYVV